MEPSRGQSKSQPTALRLRLLGPVAGWRQERPVELGPPLQRAALCMLAVHSGRLVTKEKLISGLWGGNAPQTAEQSIYTYIAGLRRVLEPGRGRRGPFTLLVNSAKGYMLLAGAVQVDAEKFEGHLADARRLRGKGDVDGALRQLEAGLRLWTGPALGGVPGPFSQAERVRLERLCLTMREEHADALLCLGRHQEAVEKLSLLVTDDPFRERARELLMLALYRCGRKAEALQVFQDARRLLAEQLGVDPGESLQRCHELILRADPSLDLPPGAPSSTVREAASSGGRAVRARPRTLPRDAAAFVGRTAEMVRLRSLLAPWDGTHPQPIVAITGPAGAGKSALAVRAAHALAEHFPDGQLYVNLRGATPGVERLKPIDALGRFLRALEVRADAVPLEADEAAAMLRDLLNGRRVLIVLDDAAGPDQVRPLLDLPSGNAVLITSRESFASVDDCAQIRLGMMPRSEAVTMLAKLVGAGRVAANTAAANRLVELCDGLPLALRLAAARLIDQPHWGVAHLVERLEDRGRILHELESGDIAVRSSLELSHDTLTHSSRQLDRVAARTLCHLGVLHLPDITAPVAAALADVPVDVAERALHRLVGAHLLEPGQHGRYQLHDLVRLFAMELSETRLSRQERRNALDRALGRYGATARHALKLVDPHRVLAPWPEDRWEPESLADGEEAYEWLESERANVLAAASQAMTADDAGIARLGAYLAFAIQWHLYRTGYHLDNLRINREALSTGRHLDDRDVVSFAHGHLGMILGTMGRGPEGLAHQQAELALQRLRGDRFAEMRALGNLGVTYISSGRYEEAVANTRLQLSIARRIGSKVGERHALFTAAEAHRRLGDSSAALTAARQALALAQEADDGYQECASLMTIARLHLDQGDLATAKSHLERALTRAREVHFHAGEGVMLTRLATVHRLLGRPERALCYARQALAVLHEIDGDPATVEEATRELAASEESLRNGDAKGEIGGSAGTEGQEQVDAVGHR